MRGGISQFWSSKYPSTSIYSTYAIYIAKDGHKCFSRSELFIDNFLYKHKIMHDKEINYVFDKKLNPKGNLRCDFFIKNTYIEFAGIWGNAKYTERLIRKAKLAKKMKKQFMILKINDIMTNGQLDETHLMSLFVTK